MKIILILLLLTVSALALKEGKEDPLFPSQVFKCPGQHVIDRTPYLDEAMYTQIVEDVHKIYIKQTNKAAEKGQVLDDHHFVGCIVRLAGHDFMDYRIGVEDETTGELSKDTGGSDGCMDLNDDDNGGLEDCAKTFWYTRIYRKWCTRVSLADFLVIAAEGASAIFEESVIDVRASIDTNNKNSLFNKFKSKFKYGRRTLQKCPVRNLMPVPSDGCQGDNGLNTVFVENVYKSASSTDEAWKWTAAISGAHTIGGTAFKNSGVPDSTWVPKDQSRRFDNLYYKHMLTASWIPAGPSKIGARAWRRGGRAFANEAVAKEFMLETDLCLVWDFNQEDEENSSGPTHAIEDCSKIGETDLCYNNKTNVPLTGKANCCAWVHHNILIDNGIFDVEEHNTLCSFPANSKHTTNDIARFWCCHRSNLNTKGLGDCQNPNEPTGPAVQHVLNYAKSNAVWIEDYVKAWNVATENNQDELKPLGSCDKVTHPCTRGRRCAAGADGAESVCGDDKACSTQTTMECIPLHKKWDKAKCHNKCFNNRGKRKLIRKCNDIFSTKPKRKACFCFCKA